MLWVLVNKVSENPWSDSRMKVERSIPYREKAGKIKLY
jgi:hypothetical protein